MSSSREIPSKPSIGPVAAGHLAVAVLVLFAVSFTAFAWPKIPPTMPMTPPPAAWVVWGLSLSYVAAIAVLHASWAFLCRSAARIKRNASLYALVHLPVVVVTFWDVTTGPGSKALLAGLGDTITALLVTSVLSMLALGVLPWLVKPEARQDAADRRRNATTVLLAGLCLLTGCATAAALCFLPFASAASSR